MGFIFVWESVCLIDWNHIRMLIYWDVFFFVKDISAKQMVSCTSSLAQSISFPCFRTGMGHDLSVENYSRFLLDIQTGSLQTTGSTRKQTNKQTGQIVQSILSSMNNASVYLDCGFLGGKPSVPSWNRQNANVSWETLTL